MKSILSRIELLEASGRADPLLVLAEDENGDTELMTVKAMLDSGRGFIKVVRGSRLADIDLLLAAFHERALQAFEGGADDG